MDAVMVARHLAMQMAGPGHDAPYGFLVIGCSFLGSYCGSAVIEVLDNDGRSMGKCFFAAPLKFADKDGRTVYVAQFPCL